MKWLRICMKDFELLLVVVLCKVGILDLLVHKNLLHCRTMHEVVLKLPEGLHEAT